MHPLLTRWLMAGLLVLGGALVGASLGDWAGHTGLGSTLGSLLGLAGFGVRDAMRAGRLLKWLRGSLESEAPLDVGFWGELGYRVERSLRLRERTAAQEAERLADFLSAIEASPNGVLLLDEQDRIAWFNRGAADHFGLEPGRDVSQRVTNLVRAPAFVAYLQAGESALPLTMTNPSGKQTLSVLVRRYGEGRFLVLSTDITERERADAMRRDFVANVSHEIRTPLTVLAGFVETLSTLPLSEGERSRVLALMAQQTDRMQALVADLLTLAQLEGSPRPPADRWFDVQPLLAQVAADGRALSAGRHAIEVVGEAAVQIAGQHSEWLSAVGNLVNNAVRYTPDGGRITVAWLPGAGGGGVVEVADNGIGIAREHHARLTERFYRVDGSRSRETGGTGLGLAIVKHVVQRHGGEVEVESEPGKGSVFRLEVPAARVRLSSTSHSLPEAAEASPAAG